MSKPTMSRADWLANFKSLMEPVGDCIEWQGAFMGTTPIAYTPIGYAWGCPYAGRHSVRSILYWMANGERLPKGSLIRPACWNGKCVDERHFTVITRKEQSAEQVRRGELITPRFISARMRVARAGAKLTFEQAKAIRESDSPPKDQAKEYGVSKATINAIRRGALWAEHFPGASIFSLGHALANFKG